MPRRHCERQDGTTIATTAPSIATTALPIATRHTVRLHATTTAFALKLTANSTDRPTPARRTPPHDHGAWATIFLLSGEEKNTLYRTDNGKLHKASEVTLTRGTILPMLADTAHVAECLGKVPAIGLHVYGGDILDLPRRMWHPETLQAHPLDWSLYEGFAQIASNAAGAPAT